ncbi:unnamed protein product [Amoebophrya sp. A120]|nr:unnamed protein product [Amoebophrya sp. A120]|eukprot:GSA120T00018012001.1
MAATSAASEDEIFGSWVVKQPAKSGRNKKKFSVRAEALSSFEDSGVTGPNFSYEFPVSSSTTSVSRSGGGGGSVQEPVAGSGHVDHVANNPDEADLLRTFCNRAQAEANLKLNRVETFDRLSCPKNVSTAGRIAQSVLSSQSYKTLFLEQHLLEQEQKPPSYEEQQSRCNSLSQPRPRPKDGAEKQAEPPVKFTNQVAFGRSVPVLQPMKEPWNDAKFNTTRAGSKATAKPTYYTENGRSLGTREVAENSKQGREREFQPPGKLEREFQPPGKLGLPPVAEDGGGPEGSTNKNNFLFYTQDQEAAQKAEDVESSWVYRLSKPRSRTEKFEFPVFMADKDKEQHELLAAAQQTQGRRGDQVVSDIDYAKNTLGGASQAAPGAPAPAQRSRSLSKPASRRPSLIRKQALGDNKLFPEELRDAVHRLVEHNRKPALVTRDPAGAVDPLEEHFLMSDDIFLGAKKNASAPASRPSSSSSNYKLMMSSALATKQWEQCLKTVSNLEHRSKSKRLPLQTVVDTTMLAGGPGGGAATTDHTVTALSGGGHHRDGTTSNVKLLNNSPYAFGQVKSLFRNKSTRTSSKQTFLSAGGKNGKNGGATSDHQLEVPQLDGQTLSRIEELLYLLIVVCDKTAASDRTGSLLSRVQQLLLADVLPLFKKLGRRVSLTVSTAANGSGPPATHIAGPTTTESSNISGDVLCAFQKHCPVLFEQVTKQAEKSLGREPIGADAVVEVRDSLLRKEFVQTAITPVVASSKGSSTGQTAEAQNAFANGAKADGAHQSDGKTGSGGPFVAAAGGAAGTSATTSSRPSATKKVAPPAVSVGMSSASASTSASSTPTTTQQKHKSLLAPPGQQHVPAGDDPFSELTTVFVQEWESVQDRNRKQSKEAAKAKTNVRPVRKEVVKPAPEELDPLGLC